MLKGGGASGAAAIVGGTLDNVTLTTQANIGTSGTVMFEDQSGVIGFRGLTATNQAGIKRFGGSGSYVYWQSSAELLTLSTGGTTTDTTGNLLPADSVIEAVLGRVTTTITTATDWKLGDATIAGRFSAANSVMTSGSTTVGTVQADQTGTSGPRQTAAAKVRVTTTGTPGAGAIRIVVFYRQFIAPTS